MTRPNPDRLKVLWQKGRNMFASFFTELEQAHRQIGNDEEFASWCFTELQVGISILTDAAKVLRKVDADLARQNLRAVRDTERAQRATARQTRRAQAEQTRTQRAEEQRRRQRRTNDRNYRARVRQRRQEAYAASVPVPVAETNVVQFPDRELVTRIKAACSRLNAARTEWIEASLELASLLCQARARHQSDRAFGEWLDQNAIDINKNDRAALLNLGTNLAAMRQTLETTERASYQYIWKEVTARIGSS